jgi:pimeloyl-ACP methyl ester carboxylesterase
LAAEFIVTTRVTPKFSLRRQKQYGDGVVAQVFRNRDRAKAYQAITQWRNDLENEGSQGTRVILFGHSWGASAAVYLARDLDRAGVPVALTIQVDSVRKHGQDDSVIPTNVGAAVNFYQTKGLIHGRSEVVAADPSHTAMLGNFRLDYEKEPAECRAYPWYNRFFFKGHTSIECDPRVWSEVQTLIETRLTSPRRVAQTELAAQLAR